MIAIKREVLEELLDSDQWRQRLEAAVTMPQVAAVLQAFCEEKKGPRKREAWRDYPAIREHLEVLGEYDEPEMDLPLWVKICGFPILCLFVVIACFWDLVHGWK